MYACACARDCRRALCLRPRYVSDGIFQGVSMSRNGSNGAFYTQGRALLAQTIKIYTPKIQGAFSMLSVHLRLGAVLC